MDILIFELDKHRYGLPLSDVQEVLHAVTIAPLPKAPTIVEGVINVRGTVIPVLNIRKRFGLPEKAVEPSAHFILARAGERNVVLPVDHAKDLSQVAPGDVEESTRVVPQGKYITGVAKLPDGLVLIHDLRTFLSEAEAVALSKVMAEPETLEAKT